jgi:predicted nucleic acid-binding protein
MIVIDSSFWIELFAGSDLGKIIKNNEDYLNANFILPSIIATEVYKKLLFETDEYTALLFTTQMKVGKVIDLSFELALISAQIGKNLKLPIADSIIYSTALQHNATLYTLDKHFVGLKNVEYFQK